MLTSLCASALTFFHSSPLLYSNVTADGESLRMIENFFGACCCIASCGTHRRVSKIPGKNTRDLFANMMDFLSGRANLQPGSQTVRPRAQSDRCYSRRKSER